MREAVFPRTLGATLLAFLLVAVSFVVVAPPAGAATELGGLVTNTFENWRPGTPGSWITGANPEYKEGDVVPFSFEVDGASAGTTYEFTACFEYFKAPANAFIALDDFDRDYPAALRGSAITSRNGGAASDGATIDGVVLLPISDTTCNPNAGELGYRVTLTATQGNFFVYFGAVAARAGLTTAYAETVASGVSSWPTGNFQAHLAQVTGAKTLPFKPGQFIPPDAPALLLVKTASPATYSAVGETISYSYLVTNTGNVSLAGPVTVSDNKATAVCPAVSTVGDNDGSLDPTESITCSASYTITQADLDAGSVTNIAFASADGTDSPTDTETVTVVAGPALLLVKTASPATYDAVGDVIGYSYLLTNSGNVTLSGPFTVTDDKSTDESCPATASLAPGASITCSASYTITQADLDAGSVTNTAQGHGFFGTAPVDSNEDFETVRTEAGPGLLLDKTASPTTYSAVGDVIGYSYLLTNSGNVTLSDPFTVTDDKASVTCPSTPTSLAPGASITCTASYTITQADLNAGSVTNTAQGFAWVGESQIASNKDSETVNRRQTPPPPPPPPALGSIGNLVWEDRDADNVQDPGEPGVPGVVVELHDANTDALLGIRVTDATGQYLFEGLEPGDYYLFFILPNGDDEFVIPNVGGDPGLDSDPDNLTVAGRTPVIKVLGNVIDKTWDAGVAFVAVAGVQITTTTPETLPFTGGELGDGGVVGIALALLALGGMALLTVRRREGQAEVASGWSGRLWDVE